MQRASSPHAVARNALPWVWITPLGAPRLPEVKSTTMSSAGRTVVSSASTMPGGAGASGSSSQIQIERRSGAAGATERRSARYERFR
jgi:hypothetical protein